MLGSEGEPLTGTPSADFLLARTAGTIYGLGGDDIILGDIGEFYIDGSDGFSGELLLPTAWSIDENPLIGNATSVPHVTVYVTTEPNHSEFFSIFIGAGETITIDIDGGGGALGGAEDCDTFIGLFPVDADPSEGPTNDDSAVTDGGYGSVDASDSFLSFTAPTTGTYRIWIGNPEDIDGDFWGYDEFLLNVSLTGHDVGPAGVQGNDTIYGGDGNDQIFGAGGDDLLFGDSGNDVIGGGSGFDSLTGGDGTDTVGYFGSPAGVAVNLATSRTSGGDAAGDIIAGFENVEGSTHADYLAGDANANELIGHAGNDTLDGGAGADMMTGGADNDTYYVDRAGDRVIEAAGGGNDTVIASASYTLGAGQEIEVLRTFGSATTDPLNLTGNEVANTLYGNAAGNVLDGKGGADLLRGYAGNDTFSFSTALGPGNVDTIVDFNPADDTIRLENAVFTGLAAGALAAGAFNSGAAATQADDRIIYNSATGALLFDVDGAGGAAAVQFATLTGAPVIAATDFLVI